MPDHRSLTGIDLHEPKGIELAAADTVYVADGAGSGDWANKFSGLNNQNRITLNTRIDDISTAGSVFVISPIAGDIVAVHVVLHGTIASAPSVVSAKINGVVVGGLSVSCTALSSVAGSCFLDTPTSAFAVPAGNAIEILTDGASSNTVAATVTILLDVS